jgi:hypothetical protein
MGKSHKDVTAAGEMARRAVDSALKTHGRYSQTINRDKLLKDASSNEDTANTDYMESLKKEYGTGHDMAIHGEGKPYPSNET